MVWHGNLVEPFVNTQLAMLTAALRQGFLQALSRMCHHDHLSIGQRRSTSQLIKTCGPHACLSRHTNPSGSVIRLCSCLLCRGRLLHPVELAACTQTLCPITPVLLPPHTYTSRASVRIEFAGGAFWRSCRAQLLTHAA